MRRAAAPGAKIARSLDQAFAKMMLPDAVDDDAGGEGISGRREPFREFEAATACFTLGQELATEDLEEMPWHFGLQLPRFASALDTRISRLAFGDRKSRFD